jgi:hypothetical protein
MKTPIPYGQWLPSQTDYQNPGLTECLNVYPTSGGYGPFQGLGSEEVDVGATILGARRLERSDGTRVIVAGTASDLYVIVGGTANASSLSLSLADDDWWQFERFGPYVFATSKDAGTFYLTDVDSDTTFSTAPGTPPSANAMARVSDFLFMGDLTDIDASNTPYRIRWSRFNNPIGTWDTDIATQSSFLDLPTTFGKVMGITGGAIGLVFQKYGINRLQYTGGGSVWRRDVIDEERGCVSTRSLARVGPVTYFMGHDGFCRTNGAQVDVISSDRVWSWFLENSNQSFNYAVQGAVNWPKRSIVWAYYKVGTTTYTGLLIYAWEQDRWSHVDLSVDTLIETTIDGTTLENLDAVYPNLDTMPLSLDDPSFQPKGREFAAFVSGSLRPFDGTTLQAEFQTGDFQLEPGNRVFVSEIVPLVENTNKNSLIAIGVRDSLGDNVSFGSDIVEGPHSYCALAADGRYARIRHRIPAGSTWEKASGIQAEWLRSGRG